MQPFKLIDLTHKLSKNTPTWNGSCGFENEIKLDYHYCEGEVKFRVQQFKLHAGIGTHLDAPSHCIPGGLTIDDIPLEQLAACCFVINVSAKSHKNFKLSVDDVRAFEEKYGRISENSFVIVYTGWDRFWDNALEYRNNLVFPTISNDAAEFLLERNIVGLGIDTLSPDLPDSGFPVHKTILGAGKYIVENIANAKELPPIGAYTLAFPIKIVDGTESPIRLVGMIFEKDKDFEEKITGGRVTSNIVRIANTIRRPVGPHSPFIHSLLKYLENTGFNAAPHFLGIDSAGREILTYIPGLVPLDLAEWSDEQLRQAAQLIRRFHNTTRGSALAGESEVVCHHDLSPCNFVFQNNVPIALIDFDAAIPGTSISDFAYALWMWCNLGEEDKDAKERGRCLKLMCDSYGLIDRSIVITEIMKQQKENVINCQGNVDKGLLEWKAAVNWSKKCLAWVEKYQTILQEEVGSSRNK